MPSSWSNKDERQYEDIKKSAKKRGKSTKTAKRIAAATVNKKRASEGRTKSKKSSSKKSSKKSGKSRKRSSSSKNFQNTTVVDFSPLRTCAPSSRHC